MDQKPYIQHLCTRVNTGTMITVYSICIFFLLEVKGASKKHFPSALPAISKKDKSELNYNRVKQLQNAKISFFPLPINLIRFDKKTHP